MLSRLLMRPSPYPPHRTDFGVYELLWVHVRETTAQVTCELFCDIENLSENTWATLVHVRFAIKDELKESIGETGA